LRSLVVLAAVALCGAWPEARTSATGPVPLYNAADAIRRAICQRVGEGADVTLVDIDSERRRRRVPLTPGPDPGAMLGKPIRFTLVTADYVALPVTATVIVTTSHAVVKQSIVRGKSVEAADVETVRAPLTGIPLVRVPAGRRCRRHPGSAGDDVGHGGAVVVCPDAPRRRAW
jgi:hypothetical protein